MLCRIATNLQSAEPVAWRSVEEEAAPPNGPSIFPPPSAARSTEPNPANARPTDLGPGGSRSGDPGPADALRRRVRELESTRQSELAQARQSGFEEGLRKGREESAAEVQKALDQLAHSILDLTQQKQKVRREAERELVRLSLAVARRILHRELLADPESIQAIVYAALQKLQNREISRVRVYPAGAGAVKAAMERIGHRNAVEIAADPALPLGGILFETAIGELDASVETQLNEIERGFADRLALT
jgi:flagellar assembly protein FliH